MRPIYTSYPSYFNSLILKPTVDGYTEKITIEGASLENIVTTPNELITQSSQRIEYDIDVDKIPEGQSDWTMFFKITNTEFPQGEFENIRVSVGKYGVSSISGYQKIYDAVGSFAINMTLDTHLLGSVQKEELKLMFTTDGGDPHNITVTDVMLIEGSYRNFIKYFKGKNGLGPDIIIKSRNKNLASEVEKGSISHEGNPDEPYLGGLRFKDFVKVEPNTEYVFTSNIGQFRGISVYDINKKLIPSIVVDINVGDDIQNMKSRVSLKVNTGTSGYYIKCKTDGINIPFKVSDGKFQLEIGKEATPYVEPKESHHNLSLPKPLYDNQYLIYDKDYNRMVAKNRLGIENDEDDPVVFISDNFDLNLKTYDEETIFTVKDVTDHGGLVLLGKMKFDYLVNPEYDINHPHLLIVLKSGDIIDTRLYKDIDKSGENNGYVIYKNGYYGSPDKVIFLNDITKIIHN